MRPRRVRRALCTLALACALAPAVAQAHGMRTAYFELTERAPGSGTALVRYTLYDRQVSFAVDGCTLTPAGGDASANRFAFSFRCPSSLAGRTVRALGLGPIVTEAVVRVALADGSVRSGVLRADRATLGLRAGGSPLAIAAEYTLLGLLHIATGWDHLLFLLALALQLWRARAVLVAETAFTLSHTLSFSATALGVVRVSPLAAEACIALSLVLLARELVAERTITPARGAWVALLFGLVHGLGVAGGLREIGLPEHDVAFALGGFGAGVELGQVAFLVLVLVTLQLGAVASRRAPLRFSGGLAVGSVGAFWFFQRLAALWASP